MANGARREIAARPTVWKFHCCVCIINIKICAEVSFPDAPAPGVDTVHFVHLTGYVVGTALYALLVLTSFDSPVKSDTGALDRRIAMGTGLLGAAWNGYALFALTMGRAASSAVAPTAGMEGLVSWLEVLAFAMLGLLPVVVVHAVTSSDEAHLTRKLRLAAYVMAALSAGAQFAAHAGLLMAASPRVLALQTLVTGLVVVMLALRPGRSRRVLLITYVLFAATALHIGAHERADESFWLVFFGHHGSLAVLIVLLWTEHRFAFSDLFLKRALVLLVVTIATVSVVGFFDVADASRRFPAFPGGWALVSCCVAIALFTPRLVEWTSTLVDRLLLRRRSETATLDALHVALAGADTETILLDRVCDILNDTLSTHAVGWSRCEVYAEMTMTDVSDTVTMATVRQAEVVVPVTEAPRYVLHVGPLLGGRRLLSQDRHLLQASGAMLGRRLDALRMEAERRQRDVQVEQLRRLASEAEMHALRAQLNPHFLFNALNTVAYLVTVDPARGSRLLYTLTSLLRTVLVRTQRDTCPLHEEIAFVRDYLAIERERFDDRLQVSIDVPAELEDVPVPPLLVQPIVENAVKHGLSARGRGGRIIVRARRTADQRLELTVDETHGRVDDHAAEASAGTGVGLANIRERLRLRYGASAAFVLERMERRGTRARILLPLEAS